VRIDVNHGCRAALGFHHPLEAHRVAFGHVRPLDDDAVGIRQIVLKGRRAAYSERDPQTGDRGGVSYTGLIFDLDYAERGEQLFNNVVLFHIERGAAHVRDAQRAPQGRAVVLFLLPRGIARLLDALGN